MVGLFVMYIMSTMCFPVTYTNSVDGTINRSDEGGISTTLQPSETNIPIPPATTTTTTTTSTVMISDPLPTSSVTSLVETGVSPQSCICSCQKLWTFLATPEPEVANLTIEEKVDIIVAELTVDKKNTSVSQRRYVSVMDDRPTSVGIGAVAAGIMFAIFGIIVIIDISRIWLQIMYVLIRIRLILKGFKIGHKDPVATLAESTSRFNVMFAAPNYDKKDPASGNIKLDTLFSCKSIPKDKSKAPSDTKIPTVVIETEKERSKGASARTSRKMDIAQNTTPGHVTLYDLTDDDHDGLHMDMNNHSLNTPWAINTDGNQHGAQVVNLDVPKQSQDLETNTADPADKPPTNEFGTRRNVHKRRHIHPKPEWRYWK